MTELPKKPHEPDLTIGEDDMFLIVGAPKSGKSTFVSEIPNCLVIDTQGGHRKLRSMSYDLVKEAKKDGKAPFQLFREVMGQLKDKCPYDALAIDTLGDLLDWAGEESRKELNKEDRQNFKSFADFEWGKGHIRRFDKVEKILTSLHDLPCTVLLVAHNRRMIDQDLTEVSKLLDISGRLANTVPGAVDHIGITSVLKGGKYVLSFEGYEHESKSGKKTIMQAGSRLKALNGKVLPTSWKAVLKAVSGGKDG